MFSQCGCLVSGWYMVYIWADLAHTLAPLEKEPRDRRGAPRLWSLDSRSPLRGAIATSSGLHGLARPGAVYQWTCGQAAALRSQLTAAGLEAWQ
jgi:hypothetical protein